MEKDHCFNLGRITKVVGFKGEVVVFIDSDEPEKYADIDTVFIDLNDNLIPFFVETISERNKGNQFTIKFQDIDDHEEAARLQGCFLYLPADLLPPLPKDAFYYHEIENFEVYDEQRGFLGTVARVLDFPANPLFEILSEKDTSILIPIQDHIIIKVDKPGKKINIRAPEGLIDMYLD